MTTNSFYFGLSNKTIDKLSIELGHQPSRTEIQDLAKNYVLDLSEGITGAAEMSQDERLKHVKLLKLNLDCWKILKDLKFSIPESILILDGKKTISQINEDKKSPKDDLNEDNFMCPDCKHEHYGKEKGIASGHCRQNDCLCGIRGLVNQVG